MPRKVMAGGGPQIIPWPSSSHACHGSHQTIMGPSPQTQRSREAQGRAGTEIMDSEEGTPRAVVGPLCLCAKDCRDWSGVPATGVGPGVRGPCVFIES